MKKFLMTVAAVAFAAPAFAGSLDVALEPVVEMPAPAPTWDGLYVGGAGGSTDLYDGDADVLTYGAFAGYNHVMGSGLMLGAEVAYSITEDIDWGTVQEPNVANYGILDLKARAGFAADKALLYVFGGYSMISENYELYGTNNYAGWNAGAGVDFLVTDSIFVGGEYIYRSLNWTEGDYELNASTIQGRVGFKF